MNLNWRSIFVVAGLGLGAGLVAPSCVIRAQVRPAYVVDQAPPAPRYETRPARAGHLWLRGKWEWRQNRWQWRRGHYVRARAGRTYEPGRWEQRGNRWHWVQGRWGAGGAAPVVNDHRRPAPAPVVHDHRKPAPGPVVHDHRKPAPGPVVHDHRKPAPAAYPTAAPPSPRYETPAARAGYVWIRGHYEWRTGSYAWVRGHWEGAKAAQVWVPGSWAARGNRWAWTPGHWTAGGPKVKVKRTRR